MNDSLLDAMMTCKGLASSIVCLICLLLAHQGRGRFRKLVLPSPTLAFLDEDVIFYNAVLELQTHLGLPAMVKLLGSELEIIALSAFTCKMSSSKQG